MRINSPIGIFDSGLGGLTVVKKILERLPSESTMYMGDEIHVPYGERSADDIRGLALGICGFLQSSGAKLIVMACNVSTAVALDSALDAFPNLPIIGMIDAGARAALRRFDRGPIGVLGTTGTVRTRAYTRTIQRLAPTIQVVEQACPRFVPIVESGEWDSEKAIHAAEEYIRPLLRAGCGTLILGCTHYPYLREVIEKIAGGDVQVVDPSEEAAEEAAAVLFDRMELNPQHAEPVHSYYTTASQEKFVQLGGRFMGSELHAVEKVSWGVDLRKMICQEKTAERTTNFGKQGLLVDT